jgi:hypothetical protein
MQRRAAGELEEVLGIDGDDDLIVRESVRPQRGIGRGSETSVNDVLRRVATFVEASDEPGREVLVDQEIHVLARLSLSVFRGRPGPRPSFT